MKFLKLSKRELYCLFAVIGHMSIKSVNEDIDKAIWLKASERTEARKASVDIIYCKIKSMVEETREETEGHRNHVK